MQGKKIQWHPGFFAGIELELKAYQLEFESEHELTRGPLSIDILIIRKLADEQIDNEIGEFFRNHNIVEYKSPSDELSIDVFFKVQAYAGLYKASGEHVDEISADQITVSLLRDSYPREMMNRLAKLGAVITKRHEGIYEIRDAGMFPTQVITIGRLASGEHAGLKVLTPKAKREDVEAFLRETRAIKDPGDLERVHSILQVSTTANKGLYEQLYKEVPEMCAALEEIMEPSLKKAEARGETKGSASGVLIGEDRLARLIAKLISLGKNKDIEKVATDKEYRDKMFEKYEIATAEVASAI